MTDQTDIAVQDNAKHWLFRKGNTNYQLRSKDGKDKLFETPKDFMNESIKYFEWCDNNPWIKKEQLKTPPKPYKDEDTGKLIWPNQILDIPTARPYTIEGLCNFLGITYQTFSNYEKDEKYKDYFEVLAYVRSVIENYQLEGGLVGAFNPAIVIRKLGLKEQIESKVENVVTSITFTSRTVEDAEFNEVQDALDQE